MSTRHATTDSRRHLAEEALHALGAHRSEWQRLSVQCAHSHHLAFVYATDAGLVYRSVSGPHSHGSKDFGDTTHHGAARSEFVDLLEPSPMAVDDLPAWCGCGPRTLSRTALLEHIRAGHRTVHLP